MKWERLAGRALLPVRPLKSGQECPLYILLSICLLSTISYADDWPTYRHDERRSGVTANTLTLPLSESWSRLSPIPPMTAWSGPAKWDAYSANDGLQSMRNFDPAFFVTAAGDSVFFGSSVDHAAHCLDAVTGIEKWVAFAGGAVRLPPAVSEGRAYFGADDGFAYCVDAGSGEEIWKHRPAENSRLIPSDGKIISPWPVRTGVLLRDGLAYFGASLVPWEKSYLCAVDAATGEARFSTVHDDMTLQGAMLASSTSLYVPQGRSVPLVFDLKDGRHIKSVGGAGGTFCLLTKDERLIAMPHDQKSAGDVIQVADPSGGSAMLSFADADRLLIDGEMAYIHQRGKLRALNLDRYGSLHEELRSITGKLNGEQRKIAVLNQNIEATKKQLAEMPEKTAEFEKSIADTIATLTPLEEEIKRLSAAKTETENQLPACFLWEADAPAPFDLIKAGTHLIVGGDGGVAVFEAEGGKQVWGAKVVGKCYGLATANGRLFVSTSRGHIYCFASQ